MLIIAFFSTDGVRNYTLSGKVEYISYFDTFYSNFGIIVRAMVSENVKYGGVLFREFL